jgi:hypothetical protein
MSGGIDKARMMAYANKLAAVTQPEAQCWIATLVVALDDAAEALRSGGMYEDASRAEKVLNQCFRS